MSMYKIVQQSLSIGFYIKIKKFSLDYCVLNCKITGFVDKIGPDAAVIPRQPKHFTCT